MTTAPQDEWQGQLLVSGTKSVPTDDVPAIGLLATIATAWLTFAERPVREPTPTALLGEWTPVQPDDAGARLAFTASALTMASPAGDRSTHHIESLRATPESGGLRLELTYPSADGPVSFRATLRDEASIPRLVFAHPEGLVWERVTSAALP